MIKLLLITSGLAAPPADAWRFVDESARAGRSIVTYRTIDLADAPARALEPADTPPAGSRYGVIALGPAGRHRLGVVWLPGTATLWVDANDDGRYAANERHLLQSSPLGIRVTIPFGVEQTRERTVLFRRRGEGVAYAVRGYATGAVRLGDMSIAALLTDGNADGCFDGAASDRVWLDLDGDGRFDPFTEQFPLGNAITVGATAILLRPEPDGLRVAVRERPNEMGSLVVRINRLAGTTVSALTVQYVSEFGELITVREADKAVTLPAGKYRLDGMHVRITDADAQVWRYTFDWSERVFEVDVGTGRGSTHAPLAAVKLELDVDGAAQPGESVQVRPNVTAGSLYLCSCRVGPGADETGREVQAQITLCGPGSDVLDRAASGFL
jgi:hypothetical protein